MVQCPVTSSGTGYIFVEFGEHSLQVGVVEGTHLGIKSLLFVKGSSGLSLPASASGGYKLQSQQGM